MLLLLLLVQDLRYSTPQGWTRNVDEASKAVQLTPAGHDAQIVLYPVTKAPLGSAQEFHALIFKSLETGGKVEGPTSGKTGDFLWTRAKLSPPTGGELRVALYTAKLGDAYVSAVYGAAEKSFDVLLPAVEEIFRGMRLVGTSIHGLDFPPLDGWTRKEDPSGSVLLQPPPPRGPLEPTWDYVMYVLPRRPLQGTHWESHRKLHDEVVKTSGLIDPVPATLEPNGPGAFIKSSTAGKNAGGAIRPLTFYSALSEGHIEAIIVANQEDVETIGALLSRVVVKSPPKEVAKTQVVEAWRRVDATIRVELTTRSLQYERIWLRADGIADFSTTYPEGYAASRVPAKLDPGLPSVGRWKAVGNALHITRRGGEEVYRREGGTLRLGDQVWQPMPSVDGLKLEGRWILPGARIAFTPAGRFQDEGVLSHVGSLPILKHAGAKEFHWPRPAARSAGTYEIRDFTLLLKFDDGTAYAADFSTLGPDHLLMGTTPLRKE